MAWHGAVYFILNPKKSDSLCICLHLKLRFCLKLTQTFTITLRSCQCDSYVTLAILDGFFLSVLKTKSFLKSLSSTQN